MACNCKKKKPAPQTAYKYTAPDGKTKEFTSELRAKMEVRSRGGKFEPVR